MRLLKTGKHVRLIRALIRTKGINPLEDLLPNHRKSQVQGPTSLQIQDQVQNRTIGLPTLNHQQGLPLNRVQNHQQDQVADPVPSLQQDRVADLQQDKVRDLLRQDKVRDHLQTGDQLLVPTI